MTETPTTPQPYDLRLARRLVPPLARLGVGPNQVTAGSLVLSLVGAGLIAIGAAPWIHIGAGLFVLARFVDHIDGELARATGSASRFGYYFDYAAGGIGYAALFGCIGVGLAGGPLGGWSYILGAVGAAAALIGVALNLVLDRRKNLGDGDSVGYPRFGGVELEDGIYLTAPITWLGWLTPFFVAAGIGSAVYCLWTFGRLARARRA
jgi:phosphatidylglycerophosphate synthase